MCVLDVLSDPRRGPPPSFSNHLRDLDDFTQQTELRLTNCLHFDSSLGPTLKEYNGSFAL